MTVAQPDLQIGLGICNRVKNPERSYMGTLLFISIGGFCGSPPEQTWDPQVTDYSQEVPGKGTATQTDSEIAFAGLGQ